MRVSLLTRNTNTPNSRRPRPSVGSSASFNSSLAASNRKRGGAGSESVRSGTALTRATTGPSTASSLASLVLSRLVVSSSSALVVGGHEVDLSVKRIAASTMTRRTAEADNQMEREREHPDGSSGSTVPGRTTLSNASLTAPGRRNHLEGFACQCHLERNHGYFQPTMLLCFFHSKRQTNSGARKNSGGFNMSSSIHPNVETKGKVFSHSG